jgi:alkanesulfonate monooxygenase SsuD/methylene tetrahydromethanopterin reductase-like flavin-dependent oxidoreductase (luciferase family)
MPTPDLLGWSVLVYCAETDERAYEEAEEHAMYLFNRLLVMPQHIFFPPGYIPEESMHQTMKTKAGLGKPGAFKFTDLVEKGYLIAGSPRTVRDRLVKYQQEIGFGLLTINVHFGNMPHYRTMKNIELLGKHVIPALHGL